MKNLKHTISDILWTGKYISTRTFRKYHPVSYEELFKLTSFVPKDAPIKQRTWHILNDRFEIPKCISCPTKVTWCAGRYNRFCCKACEGAESIGYTPEEQILLTQFLPEDAFMGNRRWHILNDDYNIQTCEMCETPVKWDFRPNNYADFCSNTCAALSPRIRQKITDTCVERHGVENPGQIPKIKLYNTIKNHERADAIIPDDILIYLNDKDHMINLHIKQRKGTPEIGEMYNVSPSTIKRKLNFHNIPIAFYNNPLEQSMIYDYIKTIYPDVVSMNDKTILKPKDIDILLPDIKIGLEVNGIYWHSSRHDRMYPNFHLDKSTNSLKKGVKLLHIFTDDWYDNRDIIKQHIDNIILTHQKLEDFTISPVTNNMKQEFYTTHHIWGDVGSSVDLGLFRDNDLIACMSFDGNHHIVRYTYLKHDMFTNLLDYYKAHYEPNEITISVDLGWNIDFDSSNWTMLSQTTPKPWNVIGGRRFYGNLDELTRTTYDIHDCGSILYKLKGL